MRKRIVAPTPASVAGDESNWLDLASLTEVEVTSEDADAPIDGAFDRQNPTGWRAARPGEQTIRLLFDSPQTLQRIELLFIEDAHERDQEFVLRYATGAGPLQEIVRQQFHFSPGGAVRELECYSVTLTNVTLLELHIIPHRGGGDAVATLARMRVA